MHTEHSHLILRERSGLVGANHRGGTHRFASVHLAHQVLVLEHTVHTQRQRECHAHRKPLRHTHHNERDGKHHRFHEIFNSGQQLERPVLCHAIHYHTPHDNGGTSHETTAGNEFAQFVELAHERRFGIVLDFCVFVDTAVFRGIAHSLHTHHAIALLHIRATQEFVDRISRRTFGIFGIYRLVANHRFASERTFVHAQRHAFKQNAVGRHFLARFHQHDIAHHHIAAWHLHDGALSASLSQGHATHHLHRHIVVDFVEHVKLFIGIILHQKSHQRGKNDGEENAERLKQRLKALARNVEQFIKSNTHRQHQCHKQDDDQWVVECG